MFIFFMFILVWQSLLSSGMIEIFPKHFWLNVENKNECQIYRILYIRDKLFIIILAISTLSWLFCVRFKLRSLSIYNLLRVKLFLFHPCLSVFCLVGSCSWEYPYCLVGAVATRYWVHSRCGCTLCWWRGCCCGRLWHNMLVLTWICLFSDV